MVGQRRRLLDYTRRKSEERYALVIQAAEEGIWDWDLITNEVYYVAQKLARLLGTNNVDNAARLCHAASTVALAPWRPCGASRSGRRRRDSKWRRGGGTRSRRRGRSLRSRMVT